MATDVAALENEVKEFKIQLETVQSSLQVDPDNAELKSLKAELEEFIRLTEASIAELKPSSQAETSKKPAQQQQQQQQQPEKEKWSKEKHPAYQAGYRKPGTDTTAAEETQTSQAPPPSYAVNDQVLARWVSGDNAFYPARITSITGSSSNPVYIVSFKSYGTTESLTAKDIKPMPHHANDSRKRKADGTPGTSASSSPAPSASVISAAADINPALASQVRRASSDPAAANRSGDGSGGRPPKIPRKVKAGKELEEGKSKWQEFTSKAKFSKATKKESMFRTPEGNVNARVGFTGSGQAMRKDPGRSKHVYQQIDDDGY
ncbi:hypothetical protein VTN31DRAFT_5828 [Thermomyces dupontii]|uniref:uncharacterized protein n=1 Tax=Talaromyces thermophilus TaxID=28565 RepID=UPI0037432E05